MTFFNKKEEVISIELTQFGKHILSKGMFKPEYYAFFDDDIIYDSNFAGVSTETQNEIVDRIKDVPRTRPQYSFSGVETEISRDIRNIRRDNQLNEEKEKLMIQPVAEKHFASAAPLGVAQLGSERTPAWSIDVLRGEIDGLVEVQVNERQPSLRIPQLDMDVVFTTKPIEGTSEGGTSNNPYWNDSIGRFGFEDGSDILLKEEFIALEIRELNSYNLNNEFEIEVFKVEQEIVDGESTDKEILIPLNFKPDIEKNYKITSNNVYVPTRPAQQEFFQLQTDNVEYFLDIDVDSQIDSQIMCKLKPVDRTKGLYSKRFYQCEDTTEEIGDIYEPSSPYDDPCED